MHSATPPATSHTRDPSNSAICTLPSAASASSTAMLPSVRTTPKRRPAGPVTPPVPLGTVLSRLDAGNPGDERSTRSPSKCRPEPLWAWYTPGRM